MSVYITDIFPNTNQISGVHVASFDEPSVHVPIMIFMNVSCSVQSWSTRWYPHGLSWQLVESYTSI